MNDFTFLPNVRSVDGYRSYLRNFTKATSYCERLNQGILCLKENRKFTDDESCQPIYEGGHCWDETLHGEKSYNPCVGTDNLDRMHKICSNGVWKNTILTNCSRLKDVYDDYTYGPDWTPEFGNLSDFDSSYDNLSYDSSYGNYEDYNQSEIVIDGDQSALSAHLSEHIILSILSLFTTLISLLLMMVFLKKSVRIYVHMNLLCAFMLRSLIYLWGNLVQGVWKQRHEYIPDLLETLQPYETQINYNSNDIRNDITKYAEKHLLKMETDHEQQCHDHMQNYKQFILVCRLWPSLQNYIVIVCFSWLACEGLYLISFAAISQIGSQRINPLRWFVAVSWLLPSVIVAIWAGAILYNDPDIECFDDNKYIWIIQWPIIFLILFCFIIFVVLLRELWAKLRAPVYSAGYGTGNFSLRMSKATITLIPLLGTQYLLLIFLQPAYGSVTLWQYKNVINPLMIFINASHGILVSVLYCFTSAEIRDAIRLRWHRWRIVNSMSAEISSRRQSRDSQNNFHFQQFINRFTPGRRGSSLSRRQENESNDENSRNDQVYNDQIAIDARLLADKRHSACSKNSDESADSNGYHSSQSANQITINSTVITNQTNVP